MPHLDKPLIAILPQDLRWNLGDTRMMTTFAFLKLVRLDYVNSVLKYLVTALSKVWMCYVFPMHAIQKY